MKLLPKTFLLCSILSLALKSNLLANAFFYTGSLTCERSMFYTETAKKQKALAKQENTNFQLNQLAEELSISQDVCGIIDNCKLITHYGLDGTTIIAQFQLWGAIICECDFTDECVLISNPNGAMFSMRKICGDPQYTIEKYGDPIKIGNKTYRQDYIVLTNGVTTNQIESLTISCPDVACTNSCVSPTGNNGNTGGGGGGNGGNDPDPDPNPNPNQGSIENNDCDGEEKTTTISTPWGHEFEVSGQIDCTCSFADDAPQGQQLEHGVCTVVYKNPTFNASQTAGANNGYYVQISQEYDDAHGGIKSRCVTGTFRIKNHNDPWRRTFGTGTMTLCCQQDDCNEPNPINYQGGINPNSNMIEVSSIIPINTKINLSPNPNSGNFTLTVNAKESNEMNVQIFDLTGKRIHNNSFYTIKGKYKKQISLPQDIPNGTYLLRARMGEEEFSEKIMIAK